MFAWKCILFKTQERIGKPTHCSEKTDTVCKLRPSWRDEQTWALGKEAVLMLVASSCLANTPAKPQGPSWVTTQTQSDAWRIWMHIKGSCGARSKFELEASLLWDIDPQLHLVTIAPRTDTNLWRDSGSAVRLLIDFCFIHPIGGFKKKKRGIRLLCSLYDTYQKYKSVEESRPCDLGISVMMCDTSLIQALIRGARLVVLNLWVPTPLDPFMGVA